MLLVVLQSFSSRGNGDWSNALALFHQMKQRWGSGFAADNSGLYVSLMELMVVEGGAQGLVAAVEVCSTAHAAGVMKRYKLIQETGNCLFDSIPSSGSSSSNSGSPAILPPITTSFASPNTFPPPTMQTLGSPDFSLNNVLQQQQQLQRGEAVQILQVVGCSGVEAVVLLLSWLRHWLSSRQQGRAVMTGEWLMIITSDDAQPSAAAADLITRPVPRLTLDSSSGGKGAAGGLDRKESAAACGSPSSDAAAAAAGREGSPAAAVPAAASSSSTTGLISAFSAAAADDSATTSSSAAADTSDHGTQQLKRAGSTAVPPASSSSAAAAAAGGRTAGLSSAEEAAAEISAQEAVMRVLKGQLPAMLGCSEGQLSQAFFEKQMNQLGALVTAPVSYMTLEGPPAAVAIQDAEVVRALVAGSEACSRGDSM